MKTKIILSLFLFSTLVNAAIIKHEALRPTFQEYSFREVCEKLGAKNFELIEAKSMNEIDCMGKVFAAIEFCKAKFPADNALTRAIVDEQTKTVKCEHSNSVMLSVSCDARDAKYCLDPQKGCEDLKGIYAVKLETAHYSFLEKKNEKNINCYFSKAIGDDLNEIL
ncbi:hypothetical protein SHI21_03225 [Bacteriovorax sp. PP10]|uniref:Uncharacterized protein n=1 Tax=Bacteriovorax antarcticus TaxID=3088717 RepID=A0ABU5VQ69_9BACT|nr:hypothetical protein [Bacteriovorax sp. PP10]MEA9355192.1 hypothetical protein [Bacteriovorax sp. PP10]